MAYGIKPSNKYSTILNEAYEAQLNLEIRTQKQAKEWLERYLIT